MSMQARILAFFNVEPASASFVSASVADAAADERKDERKDGDDPHAPPDVAATPPTPGDVRTASAANLGAERLEPASKRQRVLAAPIDATPPSRLAAKGKAVRGPFALAAGGVPRSTAVRPPSRLSAGGRRRARSQKRAERINQASRGRKSGSGGKAKAGVKAAGGGGRRAKTRSPHAHQQTHLDAGQRNWQETCSVCHMVYAPGVDDATHGDFHAAVVAANATVPFPVKKLRDLIGREDYLREGKRHIGFVRTDGPRGSHKTVAFLRGVIDGKLGCDPQAARSSKELMAVCVVGGKLAAIVILERIEHAHRIVVGGVEDGLKGRTEATAALLPAAKSPSSDADDGVDDDDDGDDNDLADGGLSVRCSLDATPALVGVSRIWVAREHRRQGLATLLLERCRERFEYCGVVRKELMAFSQPTPRGLALGTSFFGRADFPTYPCPSACRFRVG